MKLKPCPFCGGKAEIKQTGKNQLTIKCGSCYIKRVQKALRYPLDSIKAGLIIHWNTRKPLDILPGKGGQDERRIRNPTSIGQP